MAKLNKSDFLITRVSGIVSIIILIILSIWGVKTLYSQYRYEETNDAQIQEYINPITSRVGGYISKIYFDENQEVKKGDTLLIIDNSEYQLQNEESSASLENAEAQLKVLNSNINTLKKEAEVNGVSIGAAKARFLNRQKEYERYKNLFDAESATKQQLDNIEASLSVAESEYKAAQASYASSLAKVSDAQVQESVISAEIQRRTAQKKRSNIDLNYTVIKAPYDGKMGRLTIQPGQSIQPGQNLGFIVDKSSGKWVVANFKETQIQFLSEGDIVNITADAYPDKVYEGKVVSISAATGSSFSLLPPDNSSGNFVKIVQRVPVRIRLTQNSRIISVLRAGMNVNVSISKHNG